MVLYNYWCVTEQIHKKAATANQNAGELGNNDFYITNCVVLNCDITTSMYNNAIILSCHSGPLQYCHGKPFRRDIPVSVIQYLQSYVDKILLEIYVSSWAGLVWSDLLFI